MNNILALGAIAPTGDWPFNIGEQGGTFESAAFSDVSVSPVIADDPGSGVFFALPAGQAALTDLSGLMPSTAYTLSGDPSSGFGTIDLQIVNNGTPTGEMITLTNLSPFSLPFTTPADTSGLQLSASGNGGQYGIRDFEIGTA